MARVAKIDQAVLETILRKILEIYHPAQVFLYGSRAWGEPEADSDIDVFVVLEKSEDDPDERIRRGAKALSGSGLDIDLLVMTKAEVAARKDHPSTLTHRILSMGIKLYEAA
jgi:predicted nucleotidyltransferase